MKLVLLNIYESMSQHSYDLENLDMDSIPRIGYPVGLYICCIILDIRA